MTNLEILRGDLLHGVGTENFSVTIDADIEDVFFTIANGLKTSAVVTYFKLKGGKKVGIPTEFLEKNIWILEPVYF